MAFILLPIVDIFKLIALRASRAVTCQCLLTAELQIDPGWPSGGLQRQWLVPKLPWKTATGALMELDKYLVDSLVTTFPPQHSAKTANKCRRHLRVCRPARGGNTPRATGGLGRWNNIAALKSGRNMRTQWDRTTSNFLVTKANFSFTVSAIASLLRLPTGDEPS